MKHRNRALLACLLAAVPLSLGIAQPGPQGQGDQKGENPLQARVSALELELETLRSEQRATSELLQETLVYLNARSRSARSALASVDKAEELGFTAGINPGSREALLRGFRGYWGGLSEGLPAFEGQETGEEGELEEELEEAGY